MVAQGGGFFFCRLYMYFGTSLKLEYIYAWSFREIASWDITWSPFSKIMVKVVIDIIRITSQPSHTINAISRVITQETKQKKSIEKAYIKSYDGLRPLDLSPTPSTSTSISISTTAPSPSV